jgi:hypothetical protein
MVVFFLACLWISNFEIEDILCIRLWVPLQLGNFPIIGNRKQYKRQQTFLLLVSRWLMIAFVWGQLDLIETGDLVYCIHVVVVFWRGNVILAGWM